MLQVRVYSLATENHLHTGRCEWPIGLKCQNGHNILPASSGSWAFCQLNVHTAAVVVCVERLQKCAPQYVNSAWQRRVTHPTIGVRRYPR